MVVVSSTIDAVRDLAMSCRPWKGTTQRKTLATMARSMLRISASLLRRGSSAPETDIDRGCKVAPWHFGFDGDTPRFAPARVRIEGRIIEVVKPGSAAISD